MSYHVQSNWSTAFHVSGTYSMQLDPFSWYGLTCETSVEYPETPSSATKRPRFVSTYSDSGEKENERLERHCVEARLSMVSV